jgi:hypothetical protein
MNMITSVHVTNSLFRSADYHSPNSTTWNCNSCFSTTSDFLYLSKKSKHTARCSSNSTLARLSPSKRPRKPCKRDHSLRAPKIVSALCAQQSEHSETRSLNTSDSPLSSWHMHWMIQIAPQ